MSNINDTNIFFIFQWSKSGQRFLIKHLVNFIKILAELFHGTCAVADSVFDVVAKFGEGLVVTCGLEDRVVAEALPSPTLADNLAFHDAVKEYGSRIREVLDRKSVV